MRKSVKSAFLKGVGHFECKFQMEGCRPPTTVGVRVAVIALSFGIKISTVHCLVLSQSMHVTDRWTDGQNYDSENGT